MDDFSQDDALLQEFLSESGELLSGIEQDVLALEGAADSDVLNRVFRAVHTIKGTSSFLGFDQMVELTHKTEDLLNAMRRNEVHPSSGLTSTLLRVIDRVKEMLAGIRTREEHHYDLVPLLTEIESVWHLQEEVPRNDCEALIETPAKRVAEQVEPQPWTQRATDDAASATMRVDVVKIDLLIDLVGELVLERNRLSQLAREFKAGQVIEQELQEAVAQSAARLTFITNELQSASLKTRMVPVGTVLQKIPRLVRDLKTTLGKQVELVITGEETEVDKSMIERLGDPMVHLIRNSLDHGIEMPDQRVAAGKPVSGTIRIDAQQEGDQIVVAITDDGCGIEPERIRDSAIAKGLITVEASRSMSRKQILDLIFEPGFSTAKTVSNISGRGVGMDVVRTNLKLIGGSVELESTAGVGTTITLHLPLTMAILPVLMVGVGPETFAIPLRTVHETVRLEEKDIHVVEGREVLRLRDRIIPLIRLCNALDVPEVKAETGVMRAVVLGQDGSLIALLVNRFVGQESTVIKPLGVHMSGAAVIAGATISGDGLVRLVLDPATLISSSAKTTEMVSR